MGDRAVALEKLKNRAARGASGLAAWGVAAGATVAVVARNEIAVLEAMLAAAQLGALAPVINPDLPDEELAGVLADSGAGLVLASAGGLDRLATLAPGLRRLDLQAGWDGLIAGHAPRGETAAAAGGLAVTSGTTGRPKIVQRGPADPAMAPQARAASPRLFGFRKGQRTVIAGPLFHSTPNGFALATLRLDGLVVLMERFDAAELLGLIERHRITHLALAPSHMARLVKLPAAARARHDVSSLEHVLHGAAPCPPGIKRALIEWWGPVVHEFYGSTELGPVTVCDSAEALARPGTVGRPLDGTRLEVLDRDGNPCPPGITGEIFAQVGFVPPFSYRGAAATVRDGMTASGDLGFLDEEGWLFVRDRKLNVQPGESVFPAEIELRLTEHPDVLDCACLRDAAGKLVALVQPVAGCNPSDATLAGWVQQRWSDFRLRFAHTDALPREDSGKLVKRRLRVPA